MVGNGAIYYTRKTSLYQNDAGVAAIDSLASNICPGTQKIYATLTNGGSKTLTSATINWLVNGVSQTGYSWTGSLAKGGSAIVKIGTYNFSSAGSYSIKAFSFHPNGAAVDSNPTNDTSLLAITINALPSANVGINNAVCIGSSVQIGGAAVNGNTYSWVSNPAGFTNTLSNPSVSPTVNTTYTLTEKTSIGCSKTNALGVTVNPLPSATVGPAQAYCAISLQNTGGTYIGSSSSNSGHTYSWTSNPSGFTSTSAEPVVQPSVTTAYSLTETINATGCKNSNSVTISIYPTPGVTNHGRHYANACKGVGTSLGGNFTNLVYGDNYYVSYLLDRRHHFIAVVCVFINSFTQT